MRLPSMKSIIFQATNPSKRKKKQNFSPQKLAAPPTSTRNNPLLFFPAASLTTVKVARKPVLDVIVRRGEAVKLPRERCVDFISQTNSIAAKKRFLVRLFISVIEFYVDIFFVHGVGNARVPFFVRKPHGDATWLQKGIDKARSVDIGQEIPIEKKNVPIPVSLNL